MEHVRLQLMCHVRWKEKDVDLVLVQELVHGHQRALSSVRARSVDQQQSPLSCVLTNRPRVTLPSRQPLTKDSAITKPNRRIDQQKLDWCTLVFHYQLFIHFTA